MICLDLESFSLFSRTGTEHPKTVSVSTEPSSSGSKIPPEAPSLTPTQEPGANTTAPLIRLAPLAGLPTGTMACVPAQCSPLIPVLLPQQRVTGAYALYVQPTTSSRLNPLARPQPTSFAVRSMTFEDKTGQSPNGQCAAKSQPASRVPDISTSAQKRPCAESTFESSPPKAKKSDANFKVKGIRMQ